MTVLVWVDGWQIECCGEPFGVGDTVTWRLDDQPDVDWLSAALDPATARDISYSEDHHGGAPEEYPARRGTVVAIQAAFCRYAATEADQRTLYPVVGSAVLHPVVRADVREEADSDTRFNGYVVELALH